MTIARLDFSKAPPGYDIGPDTGENAGGWFWVRGPQNGEGHRGDIGRTEDDALAAAWAHHEARNDPPGCSIGLVMRGQGVTTRGDFVTDWGATSAPSVTAYKGKAQRAGAYQEARAAAWAWYKRRLALAEALDVDRTARIMAVGRGIGHMEPKGWVQAVVAVLPNGYFEAADPWPRCLTWTDEQVAEVERWLVDGGEMPAVLGGECQRCAEMDGHGCEDHQ